jgi:hypothetical protein
LVSVEVFQIEFGLGLSPLSGFGGMNDLLVVPKTAIGIERLTAEAAAGCALFHGDSPSRVRSMVRPSTWIAGGRLGHHSPADCAETIRSRGYSREDTSGRTAYRGERQKKSP